ncbi:MAG TPA: hypothetical protein VMS86_12190 [Thermoanaerobaculia bacterium]|nr:hypothetical protein [Thermoanaerobaculia bacterium]
MAGAADSEELRYFQALEEAFIRLRGAPLLLSPADWQVAQRWRSLGIPLDFAIAELSEIFARRRERGVEDRVSSLRYCARAVESHWRRAEELAGPVRRARPPAFDSARRLRSLASAIPSEWPRAAALAQQIVALEGEAAAIESALAAIDDRMLEEAAQRLGPAAAAALDAWVEERVAGLRARFTAEDRALAAARLRSRELRRRAGLPLLSLFSPDAEPDGPRGR